MTDYHETAAGLVLLEPMGMGRWGVFKKDGGAFLGTVELVTEDGRYEAVVAGLKPQECPNLKAAIQVVAANG